MTKAAFGRELSSLSAASYIVLVLLFLKQLIVS